MREGAANSPTVAATRMAGVRCSSSNSQASEAEKECSFFMNVVTGSAGKSFGVRVVTDAEVSGFGGAMVNYCSCAGGSGRYSSGVNLPSWLASRALKLAVARAISPLESTPS